MFFKAFVLVSLIASVSMAADLTAAERAALNASRAAVQKTTDANNAVSKENDAYGTALSTWASSIAKYTGSKWTSLANGTQDLVRDARVAMANGMALTPEAEGSNNAASARVAAQNLDEVNKAAAKAEAARAAADGKIGAAWEASGQAFAAVNQKIVGKVNAAYLDAKSDAKDALFESYIRMGGLNRNFNSLNSHFDDIRNAMVYMERSMDRSVMGAYMQEKTARLLSSNNLCKAAASCDKNGVNNAKFSFKDIQDIFPQNNTSSQNFQGTKPAGVK